MYLTIGQSFNYKDNSYEILEELGSGGYGTTYLVHDHSLNRQVVIKHIQSHTKVSNVINTSQEIFEREVLSLKNLGQHPQIPQLYDYFHLDNDFFLVEQFIEGYNLSKEIKPNHHWTEKQVINFLIEVLEILSFVHEKGKTHQDIKPSNLMRRKLDKKVVLIDFGAVKELSVLCEDNQGLIQPMFPIGTLGYMAPEQRNGSPRRCSDIYSLGIVAIQGITALDAENISNLINTSSLNSLLRGYKISEHLITILSQMVDFNFQNRYQYTSEVLGELKQVKRKQQNMGSINFSY